MARVMIVAHMRFYSCTLSDVDEIPVGTNPSGCLHTPAAYTLERTPGQVSLWGFLSWARACVTGQNKPNRAHKGQQPLAEGRQDLQPRGVYEDTSSDTTGNTESSRHRNRHCVNLVRRHGAALELGIAPFPKLPSLGFAELVFGANVPLPGGLLFHVVYVTFWALAYVMLSWDHPSFLIAL